MRDKETPRKTLPHTPIVGHAPVLLLDVGPKKSYEYKDTVETGVILLSHKDNRDEVNRSHTGVLRTDASMEVVTRCSQGNCTWRRSFKASVCAEGLKNIGERDYWWTYAHSDIPEGHRTRK